MSRSSERPRSATALEVVQSFFLGLNLALAVVEGGAFYWTSVGTFACLLAVTLYGIEMEGW